MTRVTLTVEQPIKEVRTYACAIVVEGRTQIVSSTKYTYFEMGTEGISTVNITGELMSAILIYNALTLSPFSCRHTYCCRCKQDWLQLFPVLLDYSITTSSWV